MEWHTKRFLGNGPGSGVDAYPRRADDGTAEWWTFDGQRTTSPLGVTLAEQKQPKFEQHTPDISGWRPIPTASEVERKLCAIACKNLDGCTGAYDYNVGYGDALCGSSDVGKTVTVTRAQFAQANR